MSAIAGIREPELLRFARIAAPLIRRAAAAGIGTMPLTDRPGAGLEFLDLRAYQPGDDPRHVDWRQSVRHGRTFVRRYRDESSADWAICVDCSESVGLVLDKWPTVARYASALAYLFLYAGHRVSLVLYADSIRGYCRMGRGAHQFSLFVRSLLEARPDGNVPAAATPDAKHSNLGLCTDLVAAHCNTFVISDFLRPDGMRDGLRRLRTAAASVNALQVTSRADAGTAATGSAMLEDAETGESIRVDVDPARLDAVHERLQDFRSSLQRDCRRMGIRFAACDVGDEWDRVLLRFLASGT